MSNAKHIINNCNIVKKKIFEAKEAHLRSHASKNIDDNLILAALVFKGTRFLELLEFGYDIDPQEWISHADEYISEMCDRDPDTGEPAVLPSIKRKVTIVPDKKVKRPVVTDNRRGNKRRG